jgi:hypothetical protein
LYDFLDEALFRSFVARGLCYATPCFAAMLCYGGQLYCGFSLCEAEMTGYASHSTPTIGQSPFDAIPSQFPFYPLPLTLNFNESYGFK